MEPETAGDPMTGLKWTRKTTEKISEELAAGGVQVSKNTVGRILKVLGFSLRVNHKKLSGKHHVDRDAQFDYINALREQFAKRGAPIISVDTKKRELVGPFRNPGEAWSRQPALVNDHDFRSEAEGIAIPYGIYDIAANHGAVIVGTSYNTPEFAVDSIVTWWIRIGQDRYPGHTELLILCDGGGSNGYHAKAWKVELQRKLCLPCRLSVTVCHYPPRASKWNPVEHRLFSEISKNWAGKPLTSYETLLNYLGTTQTKAGLRVQAILNPKVYERGIKVPDAIMEELPIRRHEALPTWNYTLLPATN